MNCGLAYYGFEKKKREYVWNSSYFWLIFYDYFLGERKITALIEVIIAKTYLLKGRVENYIEEVWPLSNEYCAVGLWKILGSEG
jgi:hypothetical protein